jgi:hypothetical protein
VLVRVRDRKKRAVKGALIRVTARGMTTIRKRTSRRGTVTVKLRGAKPGNALFHVEKRGYAPKDMKLRIR